MHPADIQSILRKAGITQQSIANETGVSSQTVHAVLYGRVKSRRIAETIAKKAGLPLSKLWPGMYDSERAPRLSRMASHGK
jgi:lambda repressor-like predicted transcriptional regulator